jgi:ketosteroid isomerase-like protein
MKKSLLGLFSFAILIMACNNKTVNNVQSIIEANNSKIVQWYATGQIDSVAAMFAFDARQMASNAAPLVGREAIRQNWANLVNLGVWKFTLTTQNVDHSGTLAVERGIYTLDFTPGPNAPEGMVAFQDKGNYLVEWRLENGKWLAVNDLAVTELSLPTTNK